MLDHPASMVGMCHQHILSIVTLMGSFCTSRGILDLFLAPVVMDFPFACFVLWCTIKRSCTWRLLDVLSLAIAHCLLSAVLWRRSCHRATLLHSIEAHLTLIGHCSSNTTFPPSSLFSIIFRIAPLWANCHSRAPFLTVGEEDGVGGEVVGIMTETGWKERERGGNKVALIRTCQEQCMHKASWESNLVFAVSLSDISAISRHRSECEPGALSDFLKCHKQKHKDMSSLWEKN